MNEIEKGVFGVGTQSAVTLSNGRLHWCVAVDRANTFSVTVDLPPGLRAGDVQALACDRVMLTVLTQRGDVHVYNANVSAWVASASLFEKAAT